MTGLWGEAVFCRHGKREAGVKDPLKTAPLQSWLPQLLCLAVDCGPVVRSVKASAQHRVARGGVACWGAPAPVHGHACSELRGKLRRVAEEAKC